MVIFDRNLFPQQFEKHPEKSIALFIKFLEASSSLVNLPGLFAKTSFYKLASLNLKLLAQLDRIAIQKIKNPDILLFIQSAYQYKYLLSAFDKFLQEIDFEELIIYCGYFCEWRRFREGILRYDDPNTVEIINTALSRKKDLMDLDQVKIYGASHSNIFDKRSSQLWKAIRSDVRLQKKIIKNFNKVDLANHLAYLVKWASQMDLELVSTKRGEYQLISNDEFKLLAWKKAGLKYQARQSYYLNQSSLKLEAIEDQVLNSDKDLYTKEASLRMWSNQYKYLKERFPEEVQFVDGRSFQSLNFFNVINSLSQHANSRWNHQMEGQMVMGVELHQAIENTIGENITIGNPVTLVFTQDYQRLLDKLSEDFKSDEAKTIIDYLAHSVDGHKLSFIDLNLKPILKIGEILYWFPGILANQDFGTVLQNNLFLDSLREKGSSNFDHLTWTNGAPKYIETLFKESGYKHTITDKTYKKSDIDLAVYEDGFLFVFEVKYTYARSRIQEIQNYTQQAKRGIQKAITQIGRHLTYLNIPGNLKGLLKEMGVVNRPKDLKIIPVILDNTFEEDGIIYQEENEIYKISDLELEVILKNEVVLLLDQEQILKLGDDIFNLSLRTDDRCLPKDLLKYIRNGRVWKKLIDNQNVILVPRQIQTGNFTITYKT